MKIMIVEDDVPSRDLLQLFLADFGQCDLASNGRQALEAVEQAMADGAPYDLICMDIMMPEMDGMEALRAIRRLEIKHFLKEADSVKIIMVTAKGQASDVMGAFDSGCEAYLIKPVSKKKLYDQLAELNLITHPDCI